MKFHIVNDLPRSHNLTANVQFFAKIQVVKVFNLLEADSVNYGIVSEYVSYLHGLWLDVRRRFEFYLDYRLVPVIYTA